MHWRGVSVGVSHSPIAKSGRCGVYAATGLEEKEEEKFHFTSTKQNNNVRLKE